jgi:hypothetical protein
MQPQLCILDERGLPKDWLLTGSSVPFLLLLHFCFLESCMEGMFSNVNHEGADDNRVSKDDMEEEHALLESV